MSVEFFGIGGPGQIGSLKKTQKIQTDKKAEGAGEDKVQFSKRLTNGIESEVLRLYKGFEANTDY